MERTQISLRSCSDTPSVDATNENVKYPSAILWRNAKCPFRNVEGRGGPCNRPGQGWWLTPQPGDFRRILRIVFYVMAASFVVYIAFLIVLLVATIGISMLIALIFSLI